MSKVHLAPRPRACERVNPGVAGLTHRLILTAARLDQGVLTSSGDCRLLASVLEIYEAIQAEARQASPAPKPPPPPDEGNRPEPPTEPPPPEEPLAGEPEEPPPPEESSPPPEGEPDAKARRKKITTLRTEPDHA